MAHLIKLEDYISRYHFDIYRYPTQFTRFKKERWENVKHVWENKNSAGSHPMYTIEPEDYFSEEKEEKGFLSKALKKFKEIKPFQRDQEAVEVEPLKEPSYNVVDKAKNYEDLKKLFLNELFSSQLLWASTSLLEQSYLNPKYKYDKRLKFFVQQIPDNYLLLYNPVFFLKQAPVDMEVILISPTDVFCISLLNGGEHSVFEVVQDRYWHEYINQEKKKIISPMIGLNRMASIVSELLRENDIKFPIKRVILSPGSFIDNPIHSAKTEFVDKRNFQAWHDRLKKHPSPLKSQQLKVGKLFLDSCLTTAYRRQEIVDEGNEHKEY